MSFVDTLSSAFSGQFFDSVVDPVSAWLGLVTFIVAVWTFLKVRYTARRLSDKYHEMAMNPRTADIAALVVDVLGRGATAQASRYARDKLGIEDPDRIISYIERPREGEAFQKEDFPDIMTNFRASLRKVSALGADRVYLFVSAPTPVILSIGAELANYGGVVIMHWQKSPANPDDQYEIWGNLRT